MRALHVLKESALWLAAAVGVLCIGLFLAAVLGGYSLIMFKTGSMAPTVPAGSLALVHEIPAESIAVGDVVTVDRAGELPVTHRVIEVVDRGETTAFRMQGDANQTPDLDTYTATTVRAMVWSAPGLAHLVAAASQPWILGLITLGAAGLVTWAFWPRDGADRSDDRAGGTDPAHASDSSHAPDLTDAAAAPTTASASASASDDPRHRQGAGRHRQGALVLAAGVGMSVVLLATGSPEAASASPVPPRHQAAVVPPAITTESVIEGDRIRITTLSSDAALSLSPGDQVPLVFGVELTAPDPQARLTPRLQSSGSLAADLSVTVVRCEQLTDSRRCPAGSPLMATDLLVSDLDGLALPPALGDDPDWIDVLVSFAAQPTTRNGTAAVSIHVDGTGPAEGTANSAADGPDGNPSGSASASASSDGTSSAQGAGSAQADTGANGVGTTGEAGRFGSLPGTGGQHPAQAFALAAGAVASGLILAALARIWQRRRHGAGSAHHRVGRSA
ncbi:MAG: signal peptidase I [Mycetocola sp.]